MAGGYEALAATCSRHGAEPIRKRLARGSLEAKGMTVAEIGREVLRAYDPDGLLFVNVNTPHDYARANKLLERLSKSSRDRIMDELGP